MTERDGTFSLEVRKWDVVDILRREHGARTFAQIITPTNSPDMLPRPELTRFASVTTFSYASDMQREQFPWSRALPTIAELPTLVRRSRARADIVFVDPWHTYDDSMTALLLALEMVNPGGHVVVHDCDPCHREAADPTPPPHCGDLWCGDTWRAFVDLTARFGPGWRWWTVDSDLGIAVIASPGSLASRHWKMNPMAAALDCISLPRRLRQRRRLADDSIRRVPADWGADQAWDWFQRHRVEALRLQPRAQWKARITDDRLA